MFPTPLPLGRRIVATFVAPSRLFADIRDGHTPWFGPLLISTGVVMLSVFAVPEAEFLAQMEGATTRRGEPVEITSDPAEITRYGRYLLMMSTAVFQPIIAFALAGILMLGFTRIPGGRASYAQYFAIVTHALLITAAGRLLSLLIAVSGGDPPDAPLSPALLSPFVEGTLRAVLQGINLFTVWALVVCALGVCIVNSRRSWKGASAVLVGGYLLLVIAVGMVAS